MPLECQQLKGQPLAVQTLADQPFSEGFDLQ